MKTPHYSKVASLLIENREKADGFWYWIRPDKSVSLADANRFFVSAILDYQIKAKIAWENGRRLAEDIAGDPEHLWEFVTSMTLDGWIAKRKEYALHRFPKAHERVWHIAQRVLRYYDGDPRIIWKSQSAPEVLARLNDLRVGEQISRMIVGALVDTGKVTGSADVKPDIHVRRVLGRVLRGDGFKLDEEDEVIELTRTMHPDNPWDLDQQLYLIGKRFCRSKDAVCNQCYLAQECAYCTNGVANSPN